MSLIHLRMMRFETFLLLLLAFSIIDNINAKRSHGGKFKHHKGLSTGGKGSSTGSKGSPTNEHGLSTVDHGSSTDQTTRQKTKNVNTDFLNAERGGAKKPTSNSSIPSIPSVQRGPASNTKESFTQSPTSTGQKNPSSGTSGPNQTIPPWGPPHGSFEPAVKAPSIGFKDDVLPNSFPNPRSMPMGNPYSFHPSENVHGSAGPTYTQPPLIFGQPAVQPFVPGQIVIVSREQQGFDIGEVIKEALVRSVVQAGVRKLINGPKNTRNTTVGNTSLPTTPSNVSTSNQTNSTINTNINTNSTNNEIFYKISDNDLFTITENLFAKSFDISKHIKLNLQGSSRSFNVTDRATQRLFEIEPELLEYPTIYVTRMLYDNYEHNFQTKLNRTKELREKENLLLDTYLNTNVMATAMQWLADRGFINPDDFERREVLRNIWFTMFGGSTCGFERVFDSENYGVSIIGVQDWLHFAIKESTGKINYMGWVDKQNLGNSSSLLTLNFQMDKLIQANRTIFVGTMPELEMSLYTICFYARPNNACPVSLGGTKFTIYTHSFSFFGKIVIDLAFPVF